MRSGIVLVGMAPVRGRLPASTALMNTLTLAPSYVPATWVQTPVGSGAALGTDVELEVRFDRDGSIDTRDDKVSATVPVKIGDDAIRVIVGS